MEEIIEQLKQEEKKAEKRLANVKMLINISESAKAIMESFAKINKINFEIKKKEFDDALNEKLKEKGLFPVGGIIVPSGFVELKEFKNKNTLHFGFSTIDASKLKEAVEKAWNESEIKFEEPSLKRRIVSATNEKDCKFIFNGKTYKADLEKGDVVYVEEDKVWLKRELKNGVAIISNGDDIFCFQENDKWFYKFELIAE